MEIIAEYSHKKGKDFLENNHRDEIEEIKEVISLVDALACRTKKSEEKTMMGKLLYSPIDLNKSFSKLFRERGWKPVKIRAKTTVPETGKPFKGFREMDQIKNNVGVEVQFGKYAFMVYNVAAKMTIFANNGIIDSGVEIVPMNSMARDMSTGVSYFEQMKTDLEMRGEADIDIPVLILGIDNVRRPKQKQLIESRTQK